MLSTNVSSKRYKHLWLVRGRVIVTGMGKSGHIARKIAATLASTGTPSHFVHPGEASHGDMGMIMPEDVVIALSNSGEVAEMTDLIHYTRRFSIPLIAITSKAQSSLGMAADITLQLPPVPEVCPMGLAPTTSTTMMLALGDALAVSAMEIKGFTAEDYQNFHPGGKLGKMLLRVSDLMREGADMPLVTSNDKMTHVLVIMTQKSLGCAGITDETGALVGIITDGDLRRHMGTNLLDHTAGQVMTKSPMTVPPSLLPQAPSSFSMTRIVPNFSSSITINPWELFISTIYYAPVSFKFAVHFAETVRPHFLPYLNLLSLWTINPTFTTLPLILVDSVFP